MLFINFTKLIKFFQKFSTALSLFFTFIYPDHIHINILLGAIFYERKEF